MDSPWHLACLGGVCGQERDGAFYELMDTYGDVQSVKHVRVMLRGEFGGFCGFPEPWHGA